MPDTPSRDRRTASVPLFAERTVDVREGAAGDGSVLEWVLRSLLRIRSEEETARVVVDLIRAATGARWAALYVTDDRGEYRLGTGSPGSTSSLGTSLSPESIDAALAHGGLPVLCPEGSPLREAVAPDVAIIAPVPLADDSRALVALGPPATGAPFATASLNLVHRVVDACSIALQNAQLVEGLRSQVYIDFLTGCYNRRGFDARLKVEVSRARRYGRPISLMLIDIDTFKWVNDSMGHPIGDYALRRLGDFLVGSFRTTDCVCRFGGDEFAIIFPETPKDEAVRMAEMLRLKIATLFPDGVLRRGMTVSLGVATLPGDADEEDHLLQAADRALYRAKGSGRNRVVIA